MNRPTSAATDAAQLVPSAAGTARSQRRFRVALAVAAGLILACAFPLIGVAGFAWVAPGLMLVAAMGVPGRRAFFLGYVSGLTHHLISLYWLLHIPVMKLAPIGGWLALSAFLALYPATWVWLCWRVYPAPLRGPYGSWSDLGDGFLTADWSVRTGWVFFCAMTWVALEIVQGRFLSGFAWNLLGASQYLMLPLIQIASFTGVYGVSFLAVWFAVALVPAGVVLLRRSRYGPRRWVAELALPLLIVALVTASGARVLMQPKETAPDLKVGLVQPSIPQRWIWSPSESSNRFVQLLRLSEAALVEKPDLLVWPEGAAPGLVRWDKATHEAVTSLVRRHQVWLVFGGDDAVPRRDAAEPGAVDFFNSSFLVSPEGEFLAVYHKQHLVIFGEYLPFHQWLPFLARWTGMESFTAGHGPVPFSIPKLGLTISVLICFEDVFPHLARRFVGEETDFLLNLTNNGWFGESAAQWQHAASAVFRAIENGLPLVRCANNGLTCWVDAQGRIHNPFFPGTKDVYGPGFKLVSVPRRNKAGRPLTFYGRHGDLFGWLCVCGSGLFVAAHWLAQRKARTVTVP